MPGPIITLLTDFGTADPFVGVMKGIILGICPEAVTVDLTHEVRPFQIRQGSFLLEQSWRYFPKGTIHLAVVDPGVGSERRPIVAQAEGHFFVGPDNGLFALKWPVVRHITAEKYFRKPVGTTFHGRDIFAPVAGYLAAGVTMEEMGPAIEDYVRLTQHTGLVLHIDRFGNVVTDLTDFAEVRVGGHVIGKTAQHYAEVPPGELFLIRGSSGFIEISVNQGSAAVILGLR